MYIVYTFFIFHGLRKRRFYSTAGGIRKLFHFRFKLNKMFLLWVSIDSFTNRFFSLFHYRLEVNLLFLPWIGL